MRSYACLLMLSLSMVSSLSAAALKAGAAVVDITPTQFPVNMPGGHTGNLATGVHDPLNARALVLDDGKTKVAWVVIDHLSVPRKVTTPATVSTWMPLLQRRRLNWILLATFIVMP